MMRYDGVSRSALEVCGRSDQWTGDKKRAEIRGKKNAGEMMLEGGTGR